MVRLPTLLVPLLLGLALSACAPALNYAPTVPPIERFDRGDIQISGYRCEYDEIGARIAWRFRDSLLRDEPVRRPAESLDSTTTEAMTDSDRDEVYEAVAGLSILSKPNAMVEPDRIGRRQFECEGTLGVNARYSSLLLVNSSFGVAGGTLQTFYPDSTDTTGLSPLDFSYLRPSLTGIVGISLGNRSFPLRLDAGTLVRFSLPFMLSSTGSVEPQQPVAFLIEWGLFARLALLETVAMEVVVSTTIESGSPLSNAFGFSREEWRYDITAFGLRVMLP